MKMNTIICATKGSKGCKAAEDKAIELAKKNNSKIIFLYIVDTKFMEKGISGGEWAKDDIVYGLKNIGKVILDIAKEKAVERGIPGDKVLTEERKGDIASQIKISVKENNADLVIVGHPETDLGFLDRYLIKKEGMEILVMRLKEQVGCEVIIV
jgi:nucleotide-binding universal stress UspA family protein